jgi:hypothetical protein
MKRLSLLVAAGLSVATVLVVVASGSAQAPGDLVFFEPASGYKYSLIDNSPKSPTRNLESSRFRFSVGDKLVFSTRVLDREGGTRVGTSHGEIVVVRGKTLRDAVVLTHAVYQLNDGQIVADGLYQPSDATTAVPIIGGAGAYEGTRGSLTNTEGRTGRSTRMHLLPS